MKVKRVIAALLLCVSALVLTVPAFGASSFSDVYDDTTAVNADMLRLMGVVQGAGGNNYLPNETLTRAAFCAMVVRVMGRESEVVNYTNRTIFSDVGSGHWGRGYINLSASIAVGENGRLIAGVGDGRFLPDNPISYAEAVTILCRVLGYGDDKAGGIWPDGYVNLAVSLGLAQGMNVSSVRGPITRAQAAQLFVNLFSSKTSGGQKFYAGLGNVTENVLFLAVNVRGDNGLTGAIRTSKGVYAPAVDGVVPTGLVGHRGALILNDRNEITAFIPDGSSSITVTLDGDAQATYLQGTNGVRYTLSSATPAYSDNSDDTKATYANLWGSLRSGDQVTLYLDGGKIVGVYYAAGRAASTEAFVVSGTVTATNLRHLTGGAEGYTIVRNGDTITLAELKKYDVITYDAVSNTLVVSDLRLNCVYDNPSPNPTAPETITVLGHTFEVLTSATDSIAQHKLGQSVTLLLTHDGKVAGMVDPVGSNLIAISGSDSVSVQLPGGGTIELKGTVREDLRNRLVTVYGSKDNVLNVTALPTFAAPGDFDRAAMTVGGYRVSAGVRLYESSDGASLVPISASRLEEQVVPQSRILYCHRDNAGSVDIIVVKAVTGDNYVYGLMNKTRVEFYVGGLSGSNGAVVVTNSEGKQSPIITAAYFEEGGFGGVAAGARTIEGVPVAADVVMLTKISGVRRSDFFRQDGVWYVKAGGASYEVAARVEGYIKATGAWFTQPEDKRLEAIRAFSDDMTVCIDPVGQKVRVIIAN